MTDKVMLDLNDKITLLVEEEGAKFFNPKNKPLYAIRHEMAAYSEDIKDTSEEMFDGKSNGKAQDRIRKRIDRGEYFKLARALSIIFPGIDFTLPYNKFFALVKQCVEQGFMPSHNLSDFIKNNSILTKFLETRLVGSLSEDQTESPETPSVVLSVYRESAKGLRADILSCPSLEAYELTFDVWEEGYLTLLVLHPNGGVSWLYPSAFNIGQINTDKINYRGKLIRSSKRLKPSKITIPRNTSIENMYMPDIHGIYEIVAFISQYQMDIAPLLIEKKIGPSFNQDDVLSPEDEAAIMLIIQENGRDQISIKREEIKVY